MILAADSQMDRHDDNYRDIQHSIEWVAKHDPNPDDCHSCGDKIETGTVDRWGDLYCDTCLPVTNGEHI